VLVVVIVVQCVPVRAVKVVDVIAVHNGLVSASIAVGVVMNLGDHMSAQRVLVVVVPVQMVRMAVMQVVDVAVVLHRNVAAGRRVPVIVIGVRRVGGHGINVLS
jgi:precorrin-2 methylase